MIIYVCRMMFIKEGMYQGVLTDKNKGETIRFRDKSILEVLTHFSMLIEDCNLEKVQIKIVKKSRSGNNINNSHDKDI